MSRIVGFASGVALAFAWAGALAQPLSLEDALRAAETHSPRLAAQRAMASSAAEQVGRAAELPDPKLRFGIENLPVTGPDRFQYNTDSMTMRSVGLMQEFPNRAKRDARNARAERQVGVETAGVAAQRASLQRDVAAAWLEVYYGERAKEALERLARQFGLQIDAVASGVARGRQSATEAFTLRQAREQANDRVIEQERMLARGRIMLAALIGDEAQRPLAAAPDTARLEHPTAHLVDRIAEHPQLRVFDERQGLARAEVDLARSTGKSDWGLEVGYGYRKPTFDNMLTVMVTLELPWQGERRQDRDVASRLAELEQARAMQEDARRMHEAEVRGWLADFDAATRRIERFRKILLPLARDRREAALAAYQGARGELAPVLEAERAITETELALIQAESERGRAWANLNFLYPAP
jgi:outer membrane protein TolC